MPHLHKYLNDRRNCGCLLYVKILSILITLFFLLQEMACQDYCLRPVALSHKEKTENKLVGHYRFDYDRYAGSELYLYKDGRYAYATFTDVSRQTSAGKWTSQRGIIELKSAIGKGSLPVKVTYASRVSDTLARKFAVVRDVTGKESCKAAIYVNHDSVTCFGGDLECFGTFRTVDSVKVAINEEIYSQWVKIDGSRGVVQLTLQTNVDLDRYFSMHIRLRKEKGKLKFVND